jgi:hypothetical protein
MKKEDIKVYEEEDVNGDINLFVKLEIGLMQKLSSSYVYLDPTVKEHYINFMREILIKKYNVMENAAKIKEEIHDQIKEIMNINYSVDYVVSAKLVDIIRKFENILKLL